MEVWDLQEEQGIKEHREPGEPKEFRGHRGLLEYRQQHLLFYMVPHRENLGRQEFLFQT